MADGCHTTFQRYYDCFEIGTGAWCWPPYNPCDTYPYCGDCWCDVFFGDPCPCDCGLVDTDACHEAVCQSDHCVTVPLSCDDGNPCTQDSCDICDGCQHAPACPSDGDPCTVDGCDPTTGACLHDPIECDEALCLECQGGSCESVCDSGCEACEDGACVDQCDTASCLACQGGWCQSVCDSGCEACEDGACVDQCDAASCLACQGGACQSTCDPVCEVCSGGSCVSTCPEGQTCCAGLCCGGTCCEGECCEPGCEDCVDGACVDQCEAADCLECRDGSCESTCDADCETCSEGQCVSTCPEGELCCNGSCCDGTCCAGTCCKPAECKACQNGECGSVCAAGEACCDGTCYNPEELTCCQYQPPGGDLLKFLCAATGTCCQDACCLAGQECCDNGVCCDDPCNECVQYGTLEGGTITADPDPACVGGTITFTLSGVTDTGGTKREDCQILSIPPVTPVYTWTVTRPVGGPVSGSGAVATVTADNPGSYSCTFTATASRECPPSALVLGPAIAAAIGVEFYFLFGGLSPEEEEDPGMFLCLNDDDDDADGVPDKDEAGPTASEDDLEPVMLFVIPSSVTGSMELSVSSSGGGQIRVYEGAERSDPVPLPRTWNVAELPVLLWVEGFATSSASRDLELRALYTGPDTSCEDRIRLTVVSVDLDVEGLTDSMEEELPGLKVSTNNDFDEGKTDAAGDPVADRDDPSPVTADGSAIAFAGLIPCASFVLPESDDVLADSTITITQTAGTGSVRVLAIRPGATAPFDDDWVEVPLGANLRDEYYLSTGPYNTFACYIEPITPGQVELTLHFQRGGTVCEDKVRLKVVEYAIVEIMYKTFIHCEVAGPTIWDPTLYDFFAGDNRTFGYGFGPTSCRTYQVAYYTVNPAKPDGSTGQDSTQLMGTSQGFDDDPDGSDVCLMGSPCAPGVAPTCGGQCSYTFVAGATAECTATTPDPVGDGALGVTSERSGESELRVTITNRAGDQCEDLVPAIDVDLNIDFRQVYDSATGVLGPLEFRASGSYDGYPWHEWYLNGTIVFLHDPCVTGDGPFSMFGSGEHNFDGSGQSPEIDPSQIGTSLDIWQPVPEAP